MRQLRVLGKKPIDTAEFWLNGKRCRARHETHDWLVYWLTDIYKFRHEIVPAKPKRHFSIDKTVDSYIVRIPRSVARTAIDAVAKARQLLEAQGVETHDPKYSRKINYPISE